MAGWLGSRLGPDDLALSVLAVLVIAIAALVPGVWDPAWPITPGLAALLAVCMQVQDLARRYFFVTERPARAFACDVVAHGGRLAVIAWLTVCDVVCDTLLVCVWLPLCVCEGD